MLFEKPLSLNILTPIFQLVPKVPNFLPRSSVICHLLTSTLYVERSTFDVLFSLPLCPSMKPGLSSVKFVRLVQPSIRVSTKAISQFTRGLIQLIRQRLFSVASSRPKAQTKLLSYQPIQTSNFPRVVQLHISNIKNLRWRADEKNQKPLRHFTTYFITPRLLITKHRPTPYQ